MQTTAKPNGTEPAIVDSGENKSRRERVRELLTAMEASLTSKADKTTVADYIRLAQLERELDQEEQPGKVVVTWRESPDTGQ